MAKDVYEDFLRLTGFEEEEMPEYLPEWRKASERGAQANVLFYTSQPALDSQAFRK